VLCSRLSCIASNLDVAVSLCFSDSLSIYHNLQVSWM
jgi:hypothetical protein